MTSPQHDPDRVDPTNQSGRPFLVTGMIGTFVIVLLILLVIGIVVL